jgi:hypothetical protein
MATHASPIDDVLDAFALEPNIDKGTLERYLRDYPEYAAELVDFSHDIFKFEREEDRPLSAEDQMRINSASALFQEAAGRRQAFPLSVLPGTRLREIADALDVPRQVILAFVERAVLVGSVPKRFLNRMATLLESNANDLIDYLSQPRQTLARAHKADTKPGNAEQINFEQLLREAGVAEDKIGDLMEDDA